MSYGIQIMSINIISANPIDKNLTRALASGAVASAEALQSETSARGNAKATIIEAEARSTAAQIDAEAAAQATLINARAAAEADRIRADGAREAADLLASSQVAVDLAKMDKSAAILGDKSKMIFSTEPGVLNNMLLRPDKL
eukprot:scaffold3158_cov389-Prasinococcus_capsulatus_cf.AAC.5